MKRCQSGNSNTDESTEDESGVEYQFTVPRVMPVFCPLEMNERVQIATNFGVNIGNDSKALATLYNSIPQQIKAGLRCRATSSHVHPILGDGNCFFRALSYFFTGSETKHFLIRNKICNWISDPQNDPMMIGYFGTIVDSKGVKLENTGKNWVRTKTMRIDKTWATEVVIQAAAYMAGCDIYVALEKTFNVEDALADEPQQDPHWTAFRCSGNQHVHSDRGIFLRNKNNHYEVVLSHK